MVLPVSIGAARVGVLTLEGPLGAQAADLISQELAVRGVATIERARLISFSALDTDLSPSAPSAVQRFDDIGKQLGVDFLFIGTVSAERGPLYSFPHVNMTLRLVQTATGQSRWIGQYGNAGWTSAISTQGDLQRGAEDLADEFVKSGGARILTETVNPS